jgi:coatomer subunit beta'
LENGTIKIYKNFSEFKAFKTEQPSDGIFGGRLLGIRSKDFVTFYDWENFDVIRRIDLSQNLKHVIWSDDGTNIVLALEDTFYLLKYDQEAVDAAIAQDQEVDEDGYEEAF